MQPMNYMIDVGNPIASLQQGYQLGAGIRNDIQKQQEAEAQRIEAERQRREQSAVIDELTSNPTADNYAKAMLVMPGAREQLKSSFELRNSAAIQNDVNEAGQLYSAIKNGAVDVAKQMLQTRLAGLENSGAPAREIQAVRAMSQLIDQNPQMVAGQALAVLQTAPGGDKILSAIATGGKEQREQELQPDLVRKGAAEAGAAEVKAKFAESDAVLDLEKKGWDIKKLQSDIQIGKQNANIAAMEAARKRSMDPLERQLLEVKIEEARASRDEKVRGKAAEVESANSNIDNMLNTIDRVMSNPSLEDVVGSFEGRIPAAASMLDDQESDAIALLDTLGSQAFLAQIPNIKGMGALSNAEGEKLQSALQNLSRAQSEKQLTSSLKEAQRLMIKARKNVADRYGVKQSVPDTPAVTPSSSEVDALLKKYGGG